MLESESGDESESGEVDSESQSDDESQSSEVYKGTNNESDGSEETERDSDNLTCDHCGKEAGHVVYLLTCPMFVERFLLRPRCSMYKCDQASPLAFSHAIGFCELCSIARNPGHNLFYFHANLHIF